MCKLETLLLVFAELTLISPFFTPIGCSVDTPRKIIMIDISTPSKPIYCTADLLLVPQTLGLIVSGIFACLWLLLAFLQGKDFYNRFWVVKEAMKMTTAFQIYEIIGYLLLASFFLITISCPKFAAGRPELLRLIPVSLGSLALTMAAFVSIVLNFSWLRIFKLVGFVSFPFICHFAFLGDDFDSTFPFRLIFKPWVYKLKKNSCK